MTVCRAYEALLQTRWYVRQKTYIYEKPLQSFDLPHANKSFHLSPRPGGLGFRALYEPKLGCERVLV